MPKEEKVIIVAGVKVAPYVATPTGGPKPDLTVSYRSTSPMFVVTMEGHYRGIVLNERDTLVLYPNVTDAIQEAERVSGASVAVALLKDAINYCREVDWDLAVMMGQDLYRVSSIVSASYSEELHLTGPSGFPVA